LKFFLFYFGFLNLFEKKILFNRFDFLKIVTTPTFSAFFNLPFAIFKGKLNI